MNGTANDSILSDSIILWKRIISSGYGAATTVLNTTMGVEKIIRQLGRCLPYITTPTTDGAPSAITVLLHEHGIRKVVCKSVVADGSLVPTGQATRAEAAQMLKNFMERQ